MFCMWLLAAGVLQTAADLLRFSRATISRDGCTCEDKDTKKRRQLCVR